MGGRSRPDATAALASLLEELRSGELPNSGEWLAKIVAVIRPGRREAPEVAEARLRSLVRLLDAQPELAAASSRHLCALIAGRMHRLLYAESGVLGQQGFWNALWHRVLGRLLPPAVDTHYLRDLVDEIFTDPRDHLWMRAITRDSWDSLFRVLDLDGPGFEPARRKCRHEALEAMRLTAVRLAALGSDTILLQYLPALARHESPFLVQAAETRDLVQRELEGSALHRDDRHLEVLLQQCEDYVEAIRRRSREAGVNVNLVFVLARIEQHIARLRRMRDLVAAADRSRVIDFFLQLVRQQNRRNSVRDLFRGTVELLARRVTERASHSGEHYITETRDEFFEMFRAAAGAGFIIAVMALVKIGIAKAELPLLWEGIAFSLNYGLGFVVIHLLHFTIATKQPAMTAATLAGSLDERDSRSAQLDALTDLAAQVSRTQWVAIAGNVMVTLLTAFAIVLSLDQFAGLDPIGSQKAAHLLHDLHPWHSLALLHAAIAGVYLFLSGLISGYYDNQALYHRIPQRLRRVAWLRRLLGEHRLAALATYVEHNLGALAGNFLFGCMLGMTPVIGELLGLPLDIRHVAFASANLAYGLHGVDFAVSMGTVVVSALGVLLVGLVNLAVSFRLALRVALRSRGLGPDQTDGLAAHVIRRFLDRPRDFFLPPARESAAS